MVPAAAAAFFSNWRRLNICSSFHESLIASLFLPICSLRLQVRISDFSPLDSIPAFTLPGGLPSAGYAVHVSAVVQNAFGATTLSDVVNLTVKWDDTLLSNENVLAEVVSGQIEDATTKA